MENNSQHHKRRRPNIIFLLGNSRVNYTLILFLSLPVVGTVGYMLTEGWSWLDALYMTIITVTTIGYGEVHQLSESGRIFTIFFVLFGVSTALYMLTKLAEIYLRTDYILDRYNRRKRKSMNNHFIVCGYGRTGRRIVEDLQDIGKDVVVVERNEEIVRELVRNGITTIGGDAAEESVLHQAGIEKASGMATTLDSDASNVFVVLTARTLRPDLNIVARAEEAHAMPKLKRAGANGVLSPYEIGAMRITHMLMRGNLLDSFELVANRTSLEVGIEEFEIDPGSPASGKSLSELNVREALNANVLALKTADGELQFPPDPSTILQAGTTIIVAAKMTDLLRLRELTDK